MGRTVLTLSMVTADVKQVHPIISDCEIRSTRRAWLVWELPESAQHSTLADLRSVTLDVATWSSLAGR